MKIYGVLNEIGWGSTVSNCLNARKSSIHRPDGKGALRSTNQKARIRRIIKRRARAAAKKEILSHLNQHQ